MAPSTQRIRGSLSKTKSSAPPNVVLLLAVVFGVLALVGVAIYSQMIHAIAETQQMRAASQQEAMPALRIKKDAAAESKGAAKAAVSASEETKREKLLLKTSIGTIEVILRPDLAKESVEYIKKIIDNGCKRCNLYRAEKPGILQGIIANKDVPVTDVKGSCPPGFENVHNDCPEWDKQCGCHGPIMTKGMIGWAAGATGPDFFIDNYQADGKWWGTQHTRKALETTLLGNRLLTHMYLTVWGQIADEASFKVINHVWTLPTEKGEGLTFLKDPIHFDMELS